MLSDRASFASASMLIAVDINKSGEKKQQPSQYPSLKGLESGANSKGAGSPDQHTVFDHAKDVASLLGFTCKQGCGMAYDRVHHENQGDSCGEVNEPVAIRTSHVRDAGQCSTGSCGSCVRVRVVVRVQTCVCVS